MELKSLLEEFDEATATHEEEAKKSAEQAEETKEEETAEEVVAPAEAEAEEALDVAETPADSVVKETPADEVEAAEEAEKAPKEEEVVEEEVEKSADSKKEEDPKEEDKKKKKKKGAKDEEDSEEDEEETDPKKKAKKKADKEDEEEEVKKSNSDEQMVGLLEAVLKSYHTSTATQANLVAKIDSLEEVVKSLSGKLEAAEEEVSKSLNVDEIKNAVAEEVEDKAVGYASKSASTEDLAPNATDEEAVAEVAAPAAQNVFDPTDSADRSAFLSRFKQENQAGKMSRGSLEGIREAYLTAGEGRADADQLQKLHEFIK